MPYPRVPSYSKSAIKRAGHVLATQDVDSKEYGEALQVVNEWRVCHGYPINTFQATLRRKTASYHDVIIAQRLKRLPTIIDKLKRYPDMDLSRMQDIGGVRGIVNSIDEVRELQLQYRDTKRFSHELVREDDYITQPKSDGYRGVHLVYKYNNTLARNGLAGEYSGLKLELQLRTKVQHSWATAVETMGTFRGEALKSRQGHTEWLEFFELVSSAFAYAENTPPVPQHADLSAIETYKAVAKLEAKLRVLENIRGISIAAKAIHTSGDYGGYYNLITLQLDEHSVTIRSYKKGQLQQASEAYANEESKASKGAKIEPVLVSAGRLRSLKQAYPNYFLDVRDFARKVEDIIQVSKEM